MSQPMTVNEMTKGERDLTEWFPLTSYVIQPTPETPPSVGLTTNSSDVTSDVTTSPRLTIVPDNSLESVYGLPTRLWSGYLNSNNPFSTSPRYFSNSSSPLNVFTYKVQGLDTKNLSSNILKRCIQHKKKIIIISATITTLLVLTIIASLAYYFTKKSEKEVTLYGILRLQALKYNDDYSEMTSSAASQLSTRICDWIMEDVTTKIQTSARFKTCRVTEYSARRGSVLASFDLVLSVSVGAEEKTEAMTIDVIKDILFAAMLATNEARVADLDVSVIYLNVYKTEYNASQTTSPTSAASDTPSLSTEVTSMSPMNPCNPNPCPSDIKCVVVDDDFFCECQVCNCTADLVNKTCGTIPSNITGSCDNLGDGFYPVVTDCTKYLWCYPGGSSIKDCPAGTAFNPNSARCRVASSCSVNVILKAPG